MIVFIITYALGLGYMSTRGWVLRIDEVGWTAVFWISCLVILLGLFHLYEKSNEGLSIGLNILAGAAGGCAIFMYSWFRYGWMHSIWWYFLFLALGIIAHYLPGGYTLMLFLMVKFNLLYYVPLPQWAWIVTIAMDVVSLGAVLRSFLSERKLKQKR